MQKFKIKRLLHPPQNNPGSAPGVLECLEIAYVWQMYSTETNVSLLSFLPCLSESRGPLIYKHKQLAYCIIYKILVTTYPHIPYHKIEQKKNVVDALLEELEG